MNKKPVQTRVFRFNDEDAVVTDFDVVVTKASNVLECSKCQKSNEVLVFGIQSDYDAEDATEVFFWCSCGNKWIEQPENYYRPKKVRNM